MNEFLNNLDNKIFSAKLEQKRKEAQLKEAQLNFNAAKSLTDGFQAIKDIYYQLTSDNWFYFPLNWVKYYTKSLWFLGNIIRDKRFEFKLVDEVKPPMVDLCILKTEYAKEHNLYRKNAYEYCPKEIQVQFTPNFIATYKAEMVDVGTWNMIVTAAEKYSGDKNIFIGVWLYCYYASSKGESPIFTASYNDIAERTGFSLNSIKKVLEQLEKINILKKLRTGSVFTTGSCYKYLGKSEN